MIEQMKRHRVVTGLVLVMLAFATMASSCEGQKTRSKKATDNGRAEAATMAEGFARVIKSQQIPVFDWSQERQILIDLYGVRAGGTHGTAIVTAIDGTLLWWCPTVGSPIPSTYQLSNPETFVDPPDRGGQTDVLVPQGEPTGVYPGDSAATWVLCVDDNGTPFAQYDEANVRWTSGVVNGLPADKRAHVDEITYTFTEGDPGE